MSSTSQDMIFDESVAIDYDVGIRVTKDTQLDEGETSLGDVYVTMSKDMQFDAYVIE